MADGVFFFAFLDRSVHELHKLMHRVCKIKHLFHKIPYLRIYQFLTLDSWIS